MPRPAPPDPNFVPTPPLCAQVLSLYEKTLRDLLTRQQLQTVFVQMLARFDAGLLEAYKTVDMGPAYSRQCVVQDVQYLRKESAKLNLNLKQGCCQDLVAFALALPVA